MHWIVDVDRHRDDSSMPSTTELMYTPHTCTVMVRHVSESKQCVTLFTVQHLDSHTHTHTSSSQSIVVDCAPAVVRSTFPNHTFRRAMHNSVVRLWVLRDAITRVGHELRLCDLHGSSYITHLFVLRQKWKSLSNVDVNKNRWNNGTNECFGFTDCIQYTWTCWFSGELQHEVCVCVCCVPKHIQPIKKREEIAVRKSMMRKLQSMPTGSMCFTIIIVLTIGIEVSFSAFCTTQTLACVCHCACFVVPFAWT